LRRFKIYTIQLFIARKLNRICPYSICRWKL